MLFLIFLSVFSMAYVDGQALGGPMHGKKVVCYLGSWAAYRPSLGSFTLENLDPSLCTHIIYSFAGLDAEKNAVKSLEPWLDLGKDEGMAGYKGLVSLKKKYPHLKCIIAIGGWNEGSLKFSNMASQAESRKAFVQNVVTFLNTYGFDGIDLNWKYPALRDGRPTDRDNFVLLVKDLSEALKSQGYILTAALGAEKTTMEKAYDLTKLSPYVDLILIMCYDYHGNWQGVVGANSPLRGRDENDVLSVEFTINYMLAFGVPPSKMVLGLPFFGRTFLLHNPDERDVEFGVTPAKYNAFKGPFTDEDGFMGYNEICTEITNKATSWTQHWDERSATPYLRDGERIISYDNARSISLKVKIAVEKGLGGLMVWSIDTDDFLGHCAHEHDAYDDFLNQLDEMLKDPVLDEALKTLNLPDDRKIGALIREPSYVTSNGKLTLRLPRTDKMLKYKLLHSINEAATLALQEKRILDEMARIANGNEVNRKEEHKDSDSITGSSLISLIDCMYIINRV